MAKTVNALALEASVERLAGSRPALPIMRAYGRNLVKVCPCCSYPRTHKARARRENKKATQEGEDDMQTKWEISIAQAASGSWVWEVSSSDQASWLTQVGVTESVEDAINEIAEIVVTTEEHDAD